MFGKDEITDLLANYRAQSLRVNSKLFKSFDSGSLHGDQLRLLIQVVCMVNTFKENSRCMVLDRKETVECNFISELFPEK